MIEGHEPFEDHVPYASQQQQHKYRGKVGGHSITTRALAKQAWCGWRKISGAHPVVSVSLLAAVSSHLSMHSFTMNTL